ncbi:3'-5' exonuclease [Tissierella creatinini]|nr:3'-5' exonuclease [Tissierella creatinini]TJX63942.1 3'-5' exonuclease [Soehngenia saccharolytica]
MPIVNHELPRMLFLDTETTGLNPGSICQLSYLVIDQGEVIPNNYYFKVDYIEPGAQRVHGLSVKELVKLSNNKGFIDCYKEFINDFNSADILVAHNFNFDIRFIKTEFKRCGINYIYNDSLCTMRYFTNICRISNINGNGYKYPRLEELVNYFGIKENTIKNATKDLFQCKGLDYHDARFDTTAAYFCFVEALNKGLIRIDKD